MKHKSDSIVRIVSNNIEADIFSPYKIHSDSESIGSGFFINDKGYILTCAHVVDGSAKVSINVPTKGKKNIPVIIHSVCYEKDLALLKTTDYANKDFCKLGNSTSMNPGDHVKAMGYPLGQERLKVTEGIISGIQDRFIQTDTPINPGNSGGPLFNSSMEVIGVNTAKMSSFIAENIGFATPINDFLLILNDMMNPPHNKLIKEPSLYCEIQHTTENHCRLFKCPSPPGCLIKKIVKGSPMYLAGLRENDILLSFDKYKLDGNGDADVEWSNDKVNLYDLIAKYTHNSEINISFWSVKNMKEKTEKVKMNVDNLYKIKYIRHPYEQIDYEIFAGMIVMELSLSHLDNLGIPDYTADTRFNLQRYKNISKRTHGILFISNILQGSYASSLSGIKAGTIIKNVNGFCVESLDDFRKAIITQSLNINGKVLSYIRLEDRNQIILDVMDAFKEEQMLSERYKYKVSGLYSILS